MCRCSGSANSGYVWEGGRWVASLTHQALAERSADVRSCAARATETLVLQGRNADGQDISTDSLVALIQPDLRAKERAAVRHLVPGNRDGRPNGPLPGFDYVPSLFVCRLGEMFVDDGDVVSGHAAEALQFADVSRLDLG